MPQNGVFVLFVYSLQGIDKQISLKTAFQRVFYHTEKLFENIYENSIKTLDNSKNFLVNAAMLSRREHAALTAAPRPIYCTQKATENPPLFAVFYRIE